MSVFGLMEEIIGNISLRYASERVGRTLRYIPQKQALNSFFGT
jgi:hypothetical protein